VIFWAVSVVQRQRHGIPALGAERTSRERPAVL
jgi:hypothetical protein